MPFGLTNAPAVFQSLIDGVFQDILGKWVIAYIDDILVYSTSLEEHVRHVQEVLSRLQWHHLFVKPKKCEFHQTTMMFLGYVITRQGVEMDSTKAAFRQLKNCFTTAPILRHPDPELPFVVEVDASSSGIGAMLSQQHGEPGKLHPCAFYSRKLMAAEANYDVGNRELLSIKTAALAGGGASPVPGPHRPSSKNCKADILSRQVEASSEPVQPDLILPATAILALVWWCLMEEIRWAHTDEPPPAGYPATKGLCWLSFSSARPRWGFFPNLGWGFEAPQPPGRPWSHLSVDFLTDLSDSGGFTTVMVVVDRFSKGCKLIPLKGSPTAMQTAEAMFQHVFRNFGLPEDIVLDRGPQFTSRVWGSLCAQLGIGISLSSGYHPQSNGQAERLNQEISRFLRSYCSREQQRWSEFLPWAEYAQNSLTHSSTGLTPFQCVLGYQSPLFPWSGEPSDDVEEWSRLSQEVWERAHVRLQRAVRRQRIQANRRRCLHPPYRVGQRVWLSTRNLRPKLPFRKLSPKFMGPFEIICQVNPVSYRLRLPASYCICHTFHVSLLKPAHPPGIGETDCIEPPPPQDIEGSLAYQVHALLDSRRIRSRIQYLVDWEGYGPEERSWVDAADILDLSLSEDFHRDHLNKPTPRPRGRPRRRTSGGVPGGGGSVMPHPRSGHGREPSPVF
ncbi:hypothetical protein QTP70_017521 [Hemibagrus guttatus]|uniref:ribonuclease H n=1 Tax=Hemibagrus guttatus TaxID=175788 RepID=A0AAE0QL72_9TELE|nr:hypothetical protein QTP70_017521 [Hemibagrus guttatus]